MTQHVKTLINLVKVLSSNPNKHMVANNHQSWDMMPSSGVSEDSNSILIYNKIFKKKKDYNEHGLISLRSGNKTVIGCRWKETPGRASS